VSNLITEFKAFVNRGNVVDLAVAVVIGAAFGRVTTSLVNDVVMPPLGLLVAGVDFANIGIVLRDAELYGSVAEAVAAGAPVILIGAFLNTVVNFVIVAFVIFLVVRAYNHMLKRFEKPVEAAELMPEPPTADVRLLTEIRDLLARRAD